jgi:hypothetical protein
LLKISENFPKRGSKNKRGPKSAEAKSTALPWLPKILFPSLWTTMLGFGAMMRRIREGRMLLDGRYVERGEGQEGGTGRGRRGEGGRRNEKAGKDFVPKHVDNDAGFWSDDERIRERRMSLDERYVG